ncbi:probable metal-nicotianamine transporter YSL7 [Mercurialis annua]|uniref:probable metal-nicotianamine transporter YSL7 n=1 Tax=Mercurialis annua TaxID=3986 RepID=UPI00215E0FB1|nr:probable metal-nicotianamine transporter YSL7 [Mercurialis annua]
MSRRSTNPPDEEEAGTNDEAVAVIGEQAFKDLPVPPWTEQITIRALVTSFFLSIVFNFIVCKLNLTTGVIPSLNVAAGLLGFFLLKMWTGLLSKAGYLKQPFTRQENTVIQTCVVASSGIAFSSGTASYILGMLPRIAAQSEGGNTPENVKHLSLGWLMGFLFIVSFIGLFSIVALRRLMILKYKLTYPSGTATAYLINSFHTPKGAKLAKKQVGILFKFFGASMIWACFQWFFTNGDDCGFASIPTFGLKAYNQRFYFDFSSTYVGVGMICPYMVNFSLLFGAIVSWGIMWPLIEAKKGNWYPSDLSASSLHGIQGYRVFIAIATMLGDGLYHVVCMLGKTAISLYLDSKKQASASIAPSDLESDEQTDVSAAYYDEQRRKEFFLKDQIPLWAALVGYLALAAFSTVMIPLFIFHQLKWYHILVAYVIAPVLAFCNAYGCGLTDWSLASNYGKFAIIIFSAWVGHDGGVIAGLASCGVMMSIVSTASDLMQDFKTGYLTLSSAVAMFFSQVAGTAMGCLITPLVFWFFYKSYPDMGEPTSTYPAPYAQVYRGIALFGVEGFSSLPKHCFTLTVGFFVGAIVVNLVRDLLAKYETKWRIHRFIPSPMCMAIPFYIGGYFTIDMCVGSVILFIWERINKQKANDFGPAVASGLICGDSLWGIPAAILSLTGVNPPLCLKLVKG